MSDHADRPQNITVRNWDKFQHYAKRNPPWIRLYRDVIDSEEWRSLSDPAARLLVEIWLLASELAPGGRVPYDLPLLAWRTGRASVDASVDASMSRSLQELAAQRFIELPSENAQNASTFASANASMSTRQRQSTEKKKNPTGSKKKTGVPDGWAPKASHLKRASELHLNVADEAEAFLDDRQAKGVKYVDWDKGFFTWLRNAQKFAANGNGRSGMTEQDRKRIAALGY